MVGENQSCSDTASGSAGERAPIDLEMLDQTFGADGRTEIVDTFVSHTVVLFQKLQAAIDEKNIVLAKDMAHQLKGMSASVYAHEFSKKSLALEGLTKEETVNWDQVKESLAALEQMFAAIKTYLQHYA